MSPGRQLVLLASMTIVLGLTSCGGEVSIKNVNPDAHDFYLVKRPNERYLNQLTYFKHEHAQIYKRREHNGLAVMPNPSGPEKTIGLALSGGGIRSAAYHLGLLSGLSKGNTSKKSILDRLDYISSVSGGGWANGAYWAWQGSDAELFGCLDDTALVGHDKASEKCQTAARMLRAKQEIGSLPVGGQRKVVWEEDIIKFYLPECNVDFSDSKNLAVCRKSYELKPYPIFNSAHSVPPLHQKANIENFPFETTPDYLGTLVDCGSADIRIERHCDENAVGFFVRQNATDFTWSNRKWQRYWKVWSREDAAMPGSLLSKAMSHSSGVVAAAPLLQYNFDLRYHGDYIEEIRKKYKMSDGGKVENLGMIPLVERGVNLIILSYMGKDTDPLENPFEDLKLARDQVQKLFNGCDVRMPELQGHEKEFIFVSSYECQNSKGIRKGDIIHVKPSHRNVEEFANFLENERDGNGIAKYVDIVKYLKNEKQSKDMARSEWFPQTSTMVMAYDEELIRAYYLLGEYVGRKHLTNKINAWLTTINNDR